MKEKMLLLMNLKICKGYMYWKWGGGGGSGEGMGEGMV